ncbi:MAG: hypothetical protein QM803_09475 [Rhodocyclaceae bacterium]
MAGLTVRHWAAVALGCALSSTAAQAAEGWQFSVQPYLWLPTINGTMRFDEPSGGVGSPEVETGPNDYLSNLNGLIMLSGEARKGDWAIIGDIVYLDFSDQDAHVKNIDYNIGGSRNPVSSSLDAGSKTTFSGLEWTLAGSRRLVNDPGGSFEVLGGLRYFGLRASADWHLTASITDPSGTRTFPANGTVDAKKDFWHGIIGVRGTVHLGSGNWYMPYYADIGAGGDSWSWQGLLGISYRFGLGDATLAYRHIEYDQSDNKLVQSLSFSGPSFGFNFRF